MATDENKDPEWVRKVWHAYLTTGDMPNFVGAPWFASRRLRPLFLHLPAEPRCRICYYPFEGVGGTIMRRFFDIRPSKLNPHLCNNCEQFLQHYKGGAEVEITILFADVRGSTSLAENMNPTEFSQLINRFYNATTKVLFDSGAFVEKLAGDAVTGFYTPGHAGPEHARLAINAGRTILKVTGHHLSPGPWVPVGVGIHTGKAFVGSVHSDSGVSDIAVLGDTANTGARLASLARTGEILVSQATAVKAGLEPSGIEIRQLELKGRSEPVEVWVMKPGYRSGQGKSSYPSS